QRRATAEQRLGVGPADPLVRRLCGGKEQLQRLVDAQQIGEPLERVARQPYLRLLAPLEIRRARVDSQQRQLLRHRQVPELGDARKGPQAGRAGNGRGDRGVCFGSTIVHIWTEYTSSLYMDTIAHQELA